MKTLIFLLLSIGAYCQTASPIITSSLTPRPTTQGLWKPYVVGGKLMIVTKEGDPVAIGDTNGLASRIYVNSLLLNKVDKVTGKSLIDDVKVTKLDGIAAGAEVNVRASWTATVGDSVIDNKPTLVTAHSQLLGIGTNTHTQIDSHISNTSNPHAVTATQVGLGNANNTSDANKPVSTAQQTALDLKANLASPTFTGTVVLPSGTSIGNVSSTEIGYIDGVTSSIQTQISARIHTDSLSNIARLNKVNSFSKKITIGSSGTPTAYLHLASGTATASTVPLKFTSGTNLTTPENGSVEYDGTNYFVTTGGVRYKLQMVATAPASATDTGVAGTIAFDATHIYYCVSTNTWVRADLASW